MEFIKGFTYGYDSRRGDYLRPEARESLRTLKERTNISHVIMAFPALQDTAQSVQIDYKGEHIISDDELTGMIEYAQGLGLKVILKPMVNVRDGTWRAYINFFDHEEPCESTWGEWFKSYTEYMCHYAQIAERTGCEILVVGCEMVMSERREKEWRNLISAVREVYKGLITYNTDKYQEDHVTWWDAVDIISSSGYYPINDWEAQLRRIEKVVKKHNKPFFFAEAGCPSRTGSSLNPNNWKHDGDADVEEQERFYREMFSRVQEADWVRGFALWEWHTFLYDEANAHRDRSYGVFGKPAEKVVAEFYSKI
ncbi:MAG: 1,4-beta-xylanase [Clostridiaceae bacterium]|nr:1,4-beta-xylanase [Clostridiaceae bacterium]